MEDEKEMVGVSNSVCGHVTLIHRQLLIFRRL